MMKSFFRLLVLLLPLSLQAAEPPQVLVSIQPLHSLASNVMQGVAAPQLLVKGSQSPHTFSLRPSDMRKVSNADLIIWIGESLETPMTKVLKSVKASTHIIELGKAKDLELLDSSEEEDDHHGHHHHHHDFDPHLWLSPENAGKIVKLLVSELSRMDPENSNRYFANGIKTQIKIKRMDRKLRRTLRPVRHQPYLVFHDAYQYFERHYRLNRVGSVTVSPEVSPGAKHVRKLVKKIKSKQVKCIFSEPQFEPKLVKMLAKEGEVKDGVLDPLGATLPAGKDHYFQLIENLATSLSQCLAS